MEDNSWFLGLYFVIYLVIGGKFCMNLFVGNATPEADQTPILKPGDLYTLVIV